jgi:hypothetical protein
MKNRIKQTHSSAKRTPEMPMETIEVKLEPELISFIERLAAEIGMEPDKFAGMVVTQYSAPQN